MFGVHSPLWTWRSVRDLSVSKISSVASCPVVPSQAASGVVGLLHFIKQEGALP